MDLAAPWLSAGEEAALLLRDASPSLAFRFPDLTLNTMREKCADCGEALTDEVLRRGWNRGGAASANDYTTVHAGCTRAGGAGGGSGPGTPAAGGGASGLGASSTSTGRFRGMIQDTAPRRFVPRFTVSSSAKTWRGTMARGPNALLFCEYLPPAVLVKELYAVVLNGQLGSTLRVRAPALFWNLVMWFLSFALPLEHLTLLAREDSAADEAAALAEAMDRWRPAVQASVLLTAAARGGAGHELASLLGSI